MSRRSRSGVDGLVVVDKPAGWTSHDVVAKLRGIYGQRRVGHAGTLDPDATGVLLVGFGRVTRLLRFLQETTKAYRGTVVFGVATSTLDAAGEVTARVDMAPTRAEVEAAAARFVGTIEQIPPMVSALKVDGRRLHELAREGVEVERAPRPVRIDSIVVEATTAADGDEPARATLLVECGSGTYIRSLAADLGHALGGVAHLASLRRLRVGAFGLDDAHTLDAIASDPGAALLTPARALRGMVTATVDEALAARVAHGAPFDTDTLAAFVGSAALAGAGADDGLRGPVAVLGPDGSLLAVYEDHGRRWTPTVVLAVPSGPAAPAASPDSA